MNSPSVSVVIASLGGQILEETLANLLTSSKSIEEIIVVLPPHTKFSTSLDRVVTYNCETKGQVVQRAFGLNRARGEFIVQMDDDIDLDDGTIESLVQFAVSIDKPVAVAPLLCSKTSREPIITSPGRFKSYFRRLFHFILGAPLFQSSSGFLSKSGQGYYLTHDYLEYSVVPVDWLPGGVIGCFKEHLVLHDYFPFTGRAYSEDLIHSYIWTQLGTSLYVLTSARAYVELTSSDLSFKDIIGEFRVKRYLVKMMRGSQFRLCLWFIASIIYSTIKSRKWK